MRYKVFAIAASVGALAAPAAVLADGTPLDLDPGTNFMLFTMNTNDGYAGGRGMVFVADEAITVDGAALWTEAAPNALNATFELYRTTSTSGNVLVGAVLLASVATPILGPLDFHGAKFPPVTLVPGESYLVRVLYAEAAAQNWFYEFDPVFFGHPPVDIGPVTLIDGTSGGDTSNFVAPFFRLQVDGGGGDVNFFLDPAEFFTAIEGSSKVSKAAWDFTPNDLPPAGAVGLDDGLDINTHGLDPDDPWTDGAGNNLWPPEVDNVQFSANATPAGPLTPVGVDGLAAGAPGFANNDNYFLTANFPATSLDILSGPPAGDNHTAVALELMNFFNGGLLEVRVYDKEDNEIGLFPVSVPPPPAKVFLGILRKDRETIGRIDIWDPAGNFEAISYIEVFRNDEPPGECTVFTNKESFEAFNEADGKFLKGTEDFDPPVSNIPDFGLAVLADPLQGGVPNVDGVGIGFPNGLVNDNLIMQSNVLGPNAPNPAPGGGLVGMGPGFIAGFPCPWDCGDNNRIVGTADLLALLAQWGVVNAPCDFDGGGVGTSDLLKLLANWGGCPQPQPIPNSVVVGPGLFADSLDLIFTPVDNHTGVGFDVIDPIAAGGTVVISVFDKNNVQMLSVDWPASDQKTFFGVWCPSTIGRINIAGIDPGGGNGGELVDNLQLWQEPEPANCDTPGVCGTYQNCQGDPNCFCFTLADGTPWCGLDQSCDTLTPCVGGTCPPGFVCQVSTCCPNLDVCVSVDTKCESPAAAKAPLPPGTLTTMGVVPGPVNQSGKISGTLRK